MVKCLFGGPTFLFKMIPIAGLDAKYLFDQVNDTRSLIAEAGGHVKAVLVDGNRTNQKFFKLYETQPGKPWLTVDGMYLLFDFVHLIKSIRNNWLTETDGELSFSTKEGTFSAKWSLLLKLYELEQVSKSPNESGVHGLSKLTEVAVKPKPIERQKVNTCLRVFCEETYTALEVHPSLQDEDVKGTTTFLKKVVDMWKILNVKSTGKDIRHKNPLEAVVTSPADSRLDYLLEVADMFLNMGKPPGGKRKRCLTKDTANSLHHTLNGIVELNRELLGSTHKYVMNGEFCSDPIEAGFNKIRFGAGSATFINVQQVTEKLHIDKTKLLLKLDVDVFNLNVDIGHECSKCGYLMDAKASEIFDELEKLEETISKDTKISLCHIAGYVTRYDDEMSEEESLGVTTFYFQKYGSFTRSLDRGGLKVPTDSACQWTFFSYLMFNTVKENVCRKSLVNLFMVISMMHGFNMKKEHGNRLANIFFKNHCIQATPRSTKEAKQKVIKLSADCETKMIKL